MPKREESRVLEGWSKEIGRTFLGQCFRVFSGYLGYFLGRGILGRSRGIFGSRGRFVFLFWWVLSFTFIFDISNKSTIMVSSVGHSLDSSIRKINSVRT